MPQMPEPRTADRVATKPVAITMGDPCGIGPEVVVKAFARGLPAPAVAIGDPALFAREAGRLGARVAVRAVSSAAEAAAGASAAAIDLPVLAVAALPQALAAGRVNAAAGDAAYRCIVRATELALAGEVRAVVTAPISKEAMNLAGHDYPGHTELLAELAGGARVRMMLANAELRTVLVTIHVALREAIASLSTDAILETITIANDALLRAGIGAPRIAVAGVNPHAGEGGMFGREEIDVVAPAVARARALGISASGPHPPDTVFMRARGMREFDVVVAMYHDQGLIPIKYLGIDDGVNVTIGLPFVRTSPDHGTAFDIAGRPGPDGRGLADERSLLAAFAHACALSPASGDAGRGTRG
jgi:4-hydroxythreonine-4-phosphate dehydrogenase